MCKNNFVTTLRSSPRLLSGRDRAWLLLALLIYCCSATAQPIENHFTHYTPKNGLAEGNITGIIQDTTGYLWIGTGNGICRFDGNTFKTYRYDPADTNSLRENLIRALLLDSKKHLWIMTPHWLHLYHPDGEWFEHFNINTLTTDMLGYTCSEENGQLIINGRKALYKFDTKRKIFSYFDQKNISGPFSDYVKDENGIEWFGTQQGLFRYDPKTKKKFLVDSAYSDHNKTGSHSVGMLTLLPGGYLLAAHYDGPLLLLNRKTCTYKEFHTSQINPDAPLEPISPVVITPYGRTDCIYLLNDSIVLLSNSGGISTFNWRRETFTHFGPDKSDPASLSKDDIRIFSIFRDREGIIWLGGEYLEKYDFRDYNVKIFPEYAKGKKMKPFVSFYDLYRCTNGKFLMGGYPGMSIYDSSTDHLVNNDDRSIYDPMLTSKRIDFFNEVDGGNIWCYTQHRIRLFSIKQDHANIIKQYQIPGNFIGVGIADMKIDHNGRILVATDSRGVAIFDTSSKTFTYFDASSRPPSQLTSSSTTAICVDHNGCTWIGTQKGMNKIEKDGVSIKQYSQNKKSNPLLADWWINDIKEDRHGIIWFTTYEHGIGRIDPVNDSVSFYSIAQGLPTCQFDKLCIDDEDNLWAVSKIGIVNLNVVTLQNKLCSEDEGFPLPDDVNTIHYSKYTKKLYILTPYSIFEIDSKNTRLGNKIPTTTITGVSVFDKEKSFTPSGNIYLKYNENFISIEFAALLFHSNKQIKYAYKMDGVDKDWVYCNYKRNASYTNLAPGHYTFSVKAQSPQGIWNDPTSLSIIIKPPFWQTWWFYLLEAILLVLCIFWITRLYTSRKLAKQKIEIEKLQAVSDERARIASDMHDELGAGLTSIRMLSEIAGGKIDRDLTVKTEIEKIERSATTLSENLREIIWTMNTRFDKLDDFIVYIRTYAVEYFDDSTITFQFYSPDYIPQITLSGELRRNLFLCCKEMLNNIVKHSKATKAALTFEVIENTLITTVTDNGIGIDMTHLNKFGTGLNTMKERLKKFGSHLEIETDNGTKLLFKINIV